MDSGRVSSSLWSYRLETDIGPLGWMSTRGITVGASAWHFRSSLQSLEMAISLSWRGQNLTKIITIGRCRPRPSLTVATILVVHPDPRQPSYSGIKGMMIWPTKTIHRLCTRFLLLSISCTLYPYCPDLKAFCLTPTQILEGRWVVYCKKKNHRRASFCTGDYFVALNADMHNVWKRHIGEQNSQRDGFMKRFNYKSVFPANSDFFLKKTT